jgi:hypothetical protein
MPVTFDDVPTPTDPAAVRSVERTVDAVRSAVLPLLEAAASRI